MFKANLCFPMQGYSTDSLYPPPFPSSIYLPLIHCSDASFILWKCRKNLVLTGMRSMWLAPIPLTWQCFLFLSNCLAAYYFPQIYRCTSFLAASVSKMEIWLQPLLSINTWRVSPLKSLLRISFCCEIFAYEEQQRSEPLGNIILPNILINDLATN